MKEKSEGFSLRHQQSSTVMRKISFSNVYYINIELKDSLQVALSANPTENQHPVYKTFSFQNYGRAPSRIQGGDTNIRESKETQLFFLQFMDQNSVKM